MDKKETALIKEAQRGNILAFESLVKKYDKQVLQLAYNMVNNTQDAEDIYQDVFVRVYNNLGRFHFKSEFSTWLYRVVVNYCINYRKKRQRNQHYSLDQDSSNDSENWQLNLQGKERSPEDLVMNEELSQEITIALAQLSHQQKSVFVLRHYHGKKLKDIARILECSEGTVKNYLFRATQKMQQQLKTYVRS